MTYLLSLERANLIASRTKMDLLKDEHEVCLENGYYWDANAIQNNLILEFLQMVRDGITGVLVAGCKARIHEVFTELGSNATGANRMNAMHRYQRISNVYVRDK